MRCSLWTGKKKEDSSLDPGPRAVTEMGKLGPSSLGHIYRGAASRVSEGLSSVVSLELVLQAHEKYLEPPFLLHIQWRHIGSLELAMMAILLPQRSRNAIHRALFSDTRIVLFLVLTSILPHRLLKFQLSSVSVLQLWR